MAPTHDPVPRLNAHHLDDLLLIAKAFGGHPDAVGARATAIGDDGIDLLVDTPGGRTTVHVDFAGTGETRPSPRLRFRALAQQAAAQLRSEGT